MLNETQVLVANSRRAWQAKKLRIVGTKVEITSVAEREPERRKDFVLYVRVCTSREVLKFLRGSSTLIAWSYIPDFECSVAKWAVPFLHDRYRRVRALIWSRRRAARS